MVWFPEIVTIVSIILTVYFGILQWEERLFKNYWTKILYPDYWLNYLKIYIFSNININEMGCDGVNIRLNSNDIIEEKKETSPSYRLPIKICLPGDKKVSKILKAHIIFKTQGDTGLELYDIKGNIIPTVDLSKHCIENGYEGRFFLYIIPQGTGINIKILIKIILDKKNNHPALFRNAQIIINGIDDKQFDINIQ